MVSLPGTELKSRGFKPSRRDGILRAIKIRKRSHVVRFYGMLKCLDVSQILNRQNCHSFVHSSYLPRISLLVGLPESSGGRVSSYHQPASSQWLSMFTYYPGDEQ
jgi:hypothetical protein